MPENPVALLDIGSGEGWALEYLQSRFYPKAELFAIEPSEACLPVLNKLGIHVIGTDVDTDWHLQYPQKFDFIIMRHVLEHFLDPIAVLKKAAQVLKPGGLLYIGIPSLDNPNRPINADFIRNVHTNYFTTVSLTNALNMSGMAPLIMLNFNEMNYHELYCIARAVKSTPEPYFSNRQFLKSRKLITTLLAEESQANWPVKLLIMKRRKKYGRILKKLFGGK